MDKPCLRIDCTDGSGAAVTRDLDAVLEAVAEANPRAVVVMETGGPVLAPWRDAVAGLVEAWYPGESGGVALARVLFGDVDPGGRLPATFPAREADLPQAGDRESFPGTNGTVKDKEGVLVGYRWFDEKQIEPAYPFGFGLSYTSFAFRDLEVAPSPTSVRMTATVRNRGARSGFAVPQLYLGLPDPNEDLMQPPFQLKGFTKMKLAPGASRRATFTLDRARSSTGARPPTAGKWPRAATASASARRHATRRSRTSSASTLAAPERPVPALARHPPAPIYADRTGDRGWLRRVGRRLIAVIDLRGRKTGSVTVEVVGRTIGGRIVRQTRTFRVCAHRR